jgi:hypothetical protein
MNTRMYWGVQHVCQSMREIRFSFNCWWLSQRVEFLEWRLAFDVVSPQPQPVHVKISPN